MYILCTCYTHIACIYNIHTIYAYTAYLYNMYIYKIYTYTHTHILEGTAFYTIVNLGTLFTKALF